MTWFEEALYPALRQSFKVERTLHRERSDYQEIWVFETPALGRVLALDGVVQTTEADEFVYHEMLTHLPLFAHDRAGQVLIIGGGDGGMLEEVLKHPVERVVMVELDPAVVEVSRRHLPAICGRAFEDPRVELVIGDGAAFVAGTGRRFDLVIVDSSDPVGPAEALFASPFYRACRDCLNPGGILVAQNGVPFLQGAELAAAHGHLGRLFPSSGCYLAPVPTYYGGFMAFGWGAGHDLASPPPGLEARIEAAGLDLRYYNAAIHRAAFALPEYIRRKIA